MKTMLAIGDLHVGNEGAVMPEDFMSESENPAKRRRHFPNKIQRILLDKWYDMVDKYQRCDILLLNGDIVDGKNYKDTGMGCWTTDTSLQVEAAKQLIKLIKPRQIIGTSGSPYHSDRNPNGDKLAVEACGGTFKGGFANITINGTRIHAMHKVSVSKSSWQYRTTPVARGMVLAALNESDLGHYDISLRSHAHYFTYAGFSSSLGMILPCWKSYDSFGDLNIEHANPAIGYVAFQFEDDGSYCWHHDIMHFKGTTLNPDVIV